MPTYFNLMSPGRTATHWLAQAVRQHPRAFCAHGPDLRPYDEAGSEMEQTARKQMDGARVSAMGMDRYFDILEQRDYAVYGTIHSLGVSPEGLAQLRRRYYVATVTREPVARLLSFMARWRQEAKEIPGRRENMARHLTPFHSSCRDRGATLPPLAGMDEDDVLFLGACYWMMSNEPVHHGFPIHRCEDLTGDRSAFAAMFDAACQGELTADAAFLDRVFAQPRMDQRGGDDRAPGIIVDSWPSWRRDLFVTLLWAFALAPVYERLGYDVRYAG